MDENARRSKHAKIGETSEIGKAIQHYKAKDKIFLFGVYASGKTLFAMVYSRIHETPWVNFDATFKPFLESGESEEHAEKYLKELPKKFIIDGLPYTGEYSSGRTYYDTDFEAVKEYIQEHKATLIVLFCSDLFNWFFRVLRFKPYLFTPMTQDNMYGIFLQVIIYYKSIYQSYIPKLDGINFKPFDSYTNKFVSIEQFHAINNENFEKIDKILKEIR